MMDTTPKMPVEAADVTLKMYYMQCLAAGSYIVAHEGFAFVVDPLRDVNDYLEFLKEHSLSLKGILLSHAHADYVGGHAELSRRTGAAILYGRRVPWPEADNSKVAACSRVAVHEGDLLHLSQTVRVRALETPGHTPGCVTWVLEKRLPEAGCWNGLAAFTGDTLFIGSCGRPDLAGLLGYTTQDMAVMMRLSLRRLARELPASCLVLPAHGAGSPCGKAMSDKLYDTLGGQLTSNSALRLAVEDEDGAAFTAFLIPGTTISEEAPEYFQMCISRNVSCAAETLQVEEEKVPRKDCRCLADVQQKNGIIIDVREPDQFWPCHAKNSYNMPLGTHGGIVLGHEDGNFSLWLGKLFAWTDDPSAADAPKATVVVNADRRDEAMTRFARVGVLKHVVGIVDGEELEVQGAKAGVEMVSCTRWTVEKMRQVPDQQYLDFRTPGEFRCTRKGTVRGALNVELAPEKQMLALAQQAGLVKEQKYVGFCIGGFRSSIATSILRRNGYQVEDVKNGYLAFTECLPELTTLSTVGAKRQRVPPGI